MTIKKRSLRIDDESNTLSLAIFPKPKVCVKLDGLKYTKSLTLIALINFSIINAVQLMDSDAFELWNRKLFRYFYHLRVGLNYFLFVTDKHGAGCYNGYNKIRLK